MKPIYVPLLQVQRDLYRLPRGRERFERYRALLEQEARGAGTCAPLLIVNPMAREEVAARLDEWLALGAEAIAAQATAELAARLADAPGGDFLVAVVVADDAGGGWTNRYAGEFARRFERPPAVQRGWLSGVLWTDDPPSPEAVRVAVRTAVLREAYIQRSGEARTLRERLAQEGAVAARAGWTGPQPEDGEIEYTRGVIEPHLEATDLPTTLRLLFGDPAARSLGYQPAGLSHWAGLALARHDAGSTTAGSKETPVVTSARGMAISRRR